MTRAEFKGLLERQGWKAERARRSEQADIIYMYNDWEPNRRWVLRKDRVAYQKETRTIWTTVGTRHLTKLRTVDLGMVIGIPLTFS